MVRKSSVRQLLLGAGGVVAMLLWPGSVTADRASLFPVRLDSDASVPARGVEQNGQRIDAVLYEVSAMGGELQGTNLPREPIADSCGDGDGCTLRLIHVATVLDQEDERGIRHRGWFFATNDQGILWSLDTGSGTYLHGSLGDSNDLDILLVIYTGNTACYLLEDSSGPEILAAYRLEAHGGGSDGVTCTLRI